MDIFLIPLLTIIVSILNIYSWVIIFYVVISWLVNFNMLNTNHQFVLAALEFLYRLTEPALKRIRRFLPSLNGVDISPILLLMLLWFIQAIVERVIYKVVF